jgi:hypothetical protein
MLHIPIVNTTPVETLTGDLIQKHSPKWSSAIRAVVAADIEARRTQMYSVG